MTACGVHCSNRGTGRRLPAAIELYYIFNTQSVLLDFAACSTTLMRLWSYISLSATCRCTVGCEYRLSLPLGGTEQPHLPLQHGHRLDTWRQEAVKK